MNALMKQMAGLSSAGFAGACCLGVPAALGALTALGLGFLIRDAFLIPVYALLLGFTLRMLHRTTRLHGRRTPFWTAVAGSVLAIGGLYLSPWVVAGGMVLVLAASIVDFVNGRKGPSCGCEPERQGGV